MKKLFILFQFILFFSLSYSQVDSLPSLILTGRVQNNSTGAGIDSVTIFTINNQNDTINIQYSSKNGKYKIMELDSGNIYFIWFTKSGYFLKHIQIDLTDFSSKFLNQNGFYADLSLIEIGYADCNIYFRELEKKPIAKAKFILNLNEIEWDIMYLQKLQKEWAIANVKAENCKQLKIQEEKQKTKK